MVGRERQKAREREKEKGKYEEDTKGEVGLTHQQVDEE